MDVTGSKKKEMAAWVLFLFVLTMTGCAGIRETKRLLLLDDISLLYEQALLSGQYRAAYRFVKIDETARSPDFDYLKDFQVSAYEFMDKNASSDGTKALVTVEIRYFHVRYLIEKVLMDEQQWEYDPEGDIWYLTSGLPDFQ